MDKKAKNMSITDIAGELSAGLTAAAGKVGILLGYTQALEAQIALLSEELENRGVDVREVMKKLPQHRPAATKKGENHGK